MAFINKNEQVIDIKLTQFGKNLLSRGAFKPTHYQFFDDDIIYDRKFAGISESQNSIEDRIKEDIRLETQHLVGGVETRFDIETEKIHAGERGVFLKLVKQMDPMEKEKILQSPLESCTVGSQETPRFVVKPYTSELKNTSGGVQYLTQSGIHGKIPQLDLEPVYNVYVDTTNTIDDPGTLYDSETYLDMNSEKIEFFDGSFIETDSECFAILVDEFNVPYTRENFEIELYEIIDTQTKNVGKSTTERKTKLVPLTNPQEIFDLFDIRTDEHANKVPHRKKVIENFYTK